MERYHHGFVDKNPGNVDKIGFSWLNTSVLLKNKDKDYENFTSSGDTSFISKHDECSGKKDQR